MPTMATMPTITTIFEKNNEISHLIHKFIIFINKNNKKILKKFNFIIFFHNFK